MYYKNFAFVKPFWRYCKNLECMSLDELQIFTFLFYLMITLLSKELNSFSRIKGRRFDSHRGQACRISVTPSDDIISEIFHIKILQLDVSCFERFFLSPISLSLDTKSLLNITCEPVQIVPVLDMKKYN